MENNHRPPDSSATPEENRQSPRDDTAQTPPNHSEENAPSTQDLLDRTKSGKTWKLAAAAAAAVIVIVILVNLFSGNNSNGADVSFHSALNYAADGKDVLVIDGTRHVFEGDEEYYRIHRFQFSLDRSRAAVLTDYGSEGGTLWHLSGNEKVKVAEEVYDFVLSDNGNGIAYITGFD